MSTTISSNRFVICPKCRNVLPQVADLPLYQCAVCDTILLGCRARGASFASVDSVFNFTHMNEFDDGSETDSLYSYVESAALGADPAHHPLAAGNILGSKVECGKSGENLRNEVNECKIGGEAIMNEVHRRSTEVGISSNTEDGCHKTSETLKSGNKEATSQREQCGEVIGPFAEQATQYLNTQKDESEIGGDPISVESETGDDAIKCVGVQLENNLHLGKVDTETLKSEGTKEVFVEPTCQKSTPKENPVGRDLNNRTRSWPISPTDAGYLPKSFDSRSEDNNMGKHHQLQSRRTFRPRSVPGSPLATGHALGRGSSQELQGKTPAAKQSKMQCGSDVMRRFNSVESISSHGCKASDISKELLPNRPFISQQICQTIPGASCLELRETTLMPDQLKMQNHLDVMGNLDGVESGSSHGRRCHDREASATSEELLQNEAVGSQNIQSFSDARGSFDSVESSSSHGRRCHGREASGTSEELFENGPFRSQQIYQNGPGSPVSSQVLGEGAAHQELQETTVIADQLKMQNRSDVMGSFDSVESTSSHGRWHCHGLDSSSTSDKLFQEKLFRSRQICRNDSPSSKFRDIEHGRIELLRKVDDLRFQLIGSLAHISGVDRKTQMTRSSQAGRRWKKHTYCLNCHVLPRQRIFCNNGLCVSCCCKQCHHSNTAGYHSHAISSNPPSSPNNLEHDKVAKPVSKDQTLKRHCRPISGGANFIICPECLDVLQMPDDFHISRMTSNKLRCGSCSQVLTLSFTKETFHSHAF